MLECVHVRTCATAAGVFVMTEWNILIGRRVAMRGSICV